MDGKPPIAACTGAAGAAGKGKVCYPGTTSQPTCEVDRALPGRPTGPQHVFVSTANTGRSISRLF